MNIQSIFFEEVNIGTFRETTGRTITEADIVLHAGQTGDFYPHHMDAVWMKTQPAGQRVAHGTLILSVAVGMTASDVNIQAMSYGYDKIRFIKPVFIGDTIRVRAEIVDKEDNPKAPGETGFVREQLTVSNQNDQTVMVLQHLYIFNKQTI